MSDERLSQISTFWSEVVRAHGGEPDTLDATRRLLLDRYSGAAYRYLLGAVRDPDAADELYQEFCLRLLRGDFRNASPERGRFRNFLKTSLFHLVVNHQHRLKKRLASLDCEVAAPSAEAAPSEEEQAFLNSWREELIQRTWRTLEAAERRSGQPCWTVLRLRADHPDLPAEELARKLGQRLGKSFTIDGFRQALRRARVKFVDLLLEEVTRSLEGPTAEEVEAELIALGLWSYCQEAWQRRQGQAGADGR